MCRPGSTILFSVPKKLGHPMLEFSGSAWPKVWGHRKRGGILQVAMVLILGEGPPDLTSPAVKSCCDARPYLSQCCDNCFPARLSPAVATPRFVGVG